ncbi:phage tail sheath subtilisin-like domain-containing protein [Fructobacillus tropaeoli]|uniref:Phage tail sheath protein n=1 Tax=Fructobacillus tropaeoli TaxID=709323 RepID=A0A3F3H2Z6_9LACO|nr:phage tail sheath subtilisin-like domain-containing protein [Fructobacillus tropaeoli]GAP04884.1 hypothetical protein FTRO_0110190 [Fructobacillus tropaeoli]
MAGGIFNGQNKTLPGAYVNVKSMPSAIAQSAGERGVVFTALMGQGWGENGLIEVTASSDFISKFGMDFDNPKLIGLRMILNNAKKALVFNANDGSKATGTASSLPFNITAKYNGDKGNNITVTVAPDSNNATQFVIETVFGTKLVDKQRVTKVSDFNSNSFVELSVKDSEKADDGVTVLSKLTNPVSVKLSGGTTSVSATAMTDIQTAMETNDFNTMVAANVSDTSALHSLFATAAKRLRNEEGKKVQAVVPAAAATSSDDEGVIVVGNAIVLDGDIELTQAQSAGFVAGITAAALPNESMTYRVVTGAKDIKPRLSNDQATEALNKGQFVFTYSRGSVKVLQDINSLHTFTETHGRDFSKNRPLRVLDDIANTLRRTWEDSFIGKVTNDANGRDLFKATVVNYLTTLQGMNAIQAFSVDDVVVRAGNTKDTVLVDLAVTTTDSMEKMYMTVTSK